MHYCRAIYNVKKQTLLSSNHHVTNPEINKLIKYTHNGNSLKTSSTKIWIPKEPLKMPFCSDNEQLYGRVIFNHLKKKYLQEYKTVQQYLKH